jgi:hypothetical protein
MTTAMVSLQWNPFSDYMQTPTGRLRLRRVSKFTFQYTQSAPKVLGNDFQFSKIDFKTEFEKVFKWSKTNFRTFAGIGDIPLTHLYNTSQITLQRNHYSKNHFSGKIVLKRCTSTSFLN